jgi:hypothetical protein
MRLREISSASERTWITREAFFFHQHSASPEGRAQDDLQGPSDHETVFSDSGIELSEEARNGLFEIGADSAEVGA